MGSGYGFPGPVFMISLDQQDDRKENGVVVFATQSPDVLKSPRGCHRAITAVFLPDPRASEETA